ncbi:development 2-like [Octopus vulgaris]|uniref:Development 2-like n=1 Tax=Octopus vulgaris TaxID=6645 RepID=A0AA36BAU9_OCTVU|nr:development 2-like [Octopus vulgaris]
MEVLGHTKKKIKDWFDENDKEIQELLARKRATWRGEPSCSVDRNKSYKSAKDLQIQNNTTSKDHVREPTIPYTSYGSTQNIMTITTEDEQTDLEENTSASVFGANATSTKDQTTTIILCSVLIPIIVLLCILCIIVIRHRYKKSKSNVISEEKTKKSTTTTCLPEEIESQLNNTLKQQAAEILPPNNAHSIRNDPCMMERELHSTDAYYSVIKDLCMVDDNVEEYMYIAKKDIYSNVNDKYENGSDTVHSDLRFTENEGYYIMNRIFILLSLLQIAYSSVDQNKHYKSAKDLQIQNNPMPKDSCWRITFYISRKFWSGTSNYFNVQLINDETRVFSNKMSCANKCRRGSQPSFDFCTPQIDPVKELKLNETAKNFIKGFVSDWRLESINLMNLNTSANYRCTLDDPDADNKGCKLNPTDYCWRITFYISRKLLSGTSNYFNVQLINDETSVFTNKLSCADKRKRGSQLSFDFCTPRIDPVKKLKLNETVKNFLTAAWKLESINLMNLNTSANYKCILSNPGAEEKGCKLHPTVIAM